MSKRLLKFWAEADKLSVMPLLVSFFLSFLIVVIFLFFYSKLPPKLPLFYSLPWGSSQLSSKQQFFLLPGLIVLITIINTFLASQLHPLQMVLRRILTLSLLVIALVITVTAFKILFLFI